MEECKLQSNVTYGEMYNLPRNTYFTRLVLHWWAWNKLPTDLQDASLGVSVDVFKTGLKIYLFTSSYIYVATF